MSAAARVGDPIEHTSALEGLLLGLAVGAAAVVVAAAAGVTIIATGGLAAVAAVGAVMALTAGFGELIGSLSWCTNKAGQIFKGSGNVFTNGKPAARAHLDTATCDKHGSVPQVIAQGSRTVHINGQPAARVGDRTVCDGKISAGSGNVNIGGATEKTDDINPEVEPWLHWLVGGIGFASAVILTSPAIAFAGLVGSFAGGIGGGILGGRWFGEGSNKQKYMAFAGALLGGGLAGKGRQWFDARYDITQEGLGSLFGNIKVTPKAAVGATARASDEPPPGSFSISDWTGYPADVPKPQGPFRLVEGPEYNSARDAANKANRAIRREQGLVGQAVDVHEINPVKFGGSPTDAANKVILPRDVHRQQVTPWWNKLQKDLGE
ncbi:PAAR domain-containing protein [Pseudomonas sp. W5-36]|uniref:PAAR domain-containing protein n=1 Tax=Pseudomonas sp. W5-36 TaxID=3097455 RepID=UPI00397CCD2E